MGDCHGKPHRLKPTCGDKAQLRPVQSNWVKKELEIAFSQELSQDRYKILPILKDDCDIPAFLQGKLYSDFSKQSKRKENIARLIGSIAPSRAFIIELEKAAKKYSQDDLKITVAKNVRFEDKGEE